MLGAVVLLAVVSGCRKEEPRQAEAPAPAGPVTLVPSHGASDVAGLAWEAPKEWVAETPSSGMRRAQYRLPPATGDTEAGECAVFYFGAGQGGDAQANVQRWASQFVDAAGAPAAPKVTQIKAGDRTVTRVEVRGTYQPPAMGAPHGGGSPRPDSMLLGAIVPGADANWFFKCTGPERTMERNRESFDALIASVHPGS